MNLEELKTIINAPLSDEIKKSEIINSLAKDENVILIIMKILEREREIKKELFEEINLLLSKADTGLDNPSLNENNFMQKEIFDFYKKYKNIKGVGHCFKMLNFNQ